MPLKILQTDGVTALVEYPDGRQAEMPADIAQEAEQASYEPTGQAVPGDELRQDRYLDASSPPGVAETAEITMPPDVTAYGERRLDALDAGGAGYGAPVPNPQITPHGDFGAPRDGGARQHQGVDFVAPEGTPILAVGDGVVEAVGPSEGDGGRGGVRVIVRHPDGTTSNSMHLSKTLVTPGQTVTQGQPIGEAGNTGTSDGAHLHQQFRDAAGNPVSPGQFYGGQSPGAGLLPGGHSSRQSGSFSGFVSNEPRTPGVGPPPGPPEPGGYLGEFARGQELRAQGAELALGAQEGLFQEQARLAGNVSEEHRRAVEQHARAQAMATQERAAYEANIADAMSKVAQVDPGRIWRNAGTFGSAMGIMSAAIGGWLQVTRGGPNHALEAIQRLMNTDIQAQETDIGTQREAVFRAERAGERAEHRIADRYRQAEESRMLRLQSLIEASKQRALQFESPIARAKHMEFVGQLQAEWANAYKNASEKFYEQRYQAWHGAESQRHALEMERIARGQLSVSAANAETDRLKAAQAGKDQNPPLLLGNPLKRSGTYWQVDPNISASMSKEEGAKLRDMEKGFPLKADVIKKAKDYVSALSDIGRTYAGLGQFSRFSPNADERRKLVQLHEAFAGARRRAISGQSLTDNEIKNFNKIAPPPPGELDADTINQAVEYVALEADSAQALINTYKISEVNPSTGEARPVDLTTEWGDIRALTVKPPDGSELWQRMTESMRGVELESRPTPTDTFTPKEPKRGEPPSTFTGEPKGSKKPITQETAASVVRDAHQFLNYLRKAPGETGTTFDLAEKVISDMASWASTLDAKGYETEAGDLLDVASDIKAELTEHARRFRELEKTRQGVQKGHLPDIGGGL